MQMLSFGRGMVFVVVSSGVLLALLFCVVLVAFILFWSWHCGCCGGVLIVVMSSWHCCGCRNCCMVVHAARLLLQWWFGGGIVFQ